MLTELQPSLHCVLYGLVCGLILGQWMRLGHLFLPPDGPLMNAWILVGMVLILAGAGALMGVWL